ncbi:hypothetical protein B0T26DRAFT_798511 [Lasiosphaeria miniovina]|uniref:Metallo-beta-lactamase domain-containing protein n=1 Tax=Lasiosphaeria miniovina TaxID=1954250 RepID=A0AA40BID1_9PEZI|nr:uncharacterized protein B0T26DRAFT_798511 [Lasiosphaeria miniovina]KAK0734762.1 hypothetical protein B0T26DRAFT_798511 [Lasiosphaeria miniovina]
MMPELQVDNLQPVWAGLRVLTDPNFLYAGDYVYLHPGVTATRLKDLAVDLAELPPLNCILLSYYHEDHFDKLAEASLDRRVPIVTTPHARECPTTKKPGGDKAWSADSGLATTGYRIYISGDTLFIDELQQIPQFLHHQRVDLMLVHLGGTTIPGPHIPLLIVAMDAAQGVRLIRLVDPEVTIPVDERTVNVTTVATHKFDRNFERFIRTDEDDEWMVPTIEFSELRTQSDTNYASYDSDAHGHSYKHILSGPATAVIQIVGSEHINNYYVENTLIDDYIEDLDTEGDSSLESVINSNSSTSNGDESVRASPPNTQPYSEENSPQTTAATLATTPFAAESSPKEEKLSTITITSADTAHTERGVNFEGSFPVPGSRFADLQYAVTTRFEIFWYLLNVLGTGQAWPSWVHQFAPAISPKRAQGHDLLAKEDQTFAAITGAETDNLQGYFPVPGATDRGLQYAISREGKVFYEDDMVAFNTKYTIEIEYVEPSQEEGLTIEEETSEQESEDNKKDITIIHIYPVSNTDVKELLYAFGSDELIY